MQRTIQACDTLKCETIRQMALLPTLELAGMARRLGELRDSVDQAEEGQELQRDLEERLGTLHQVGLAACWSCCRPFRPNVLLFQDLFRVHSSLKVRDGSLAKIRDESLIVKFCDESGWGSSNQGMRINLVTNERFPSGLYIASIVLQVRWKSDFKFERSSSSSL